MHVPESKDIMLPCDNYILIILRLSDLAFLSNDDIICLFVLVRSRVMGAHICDAMSGSTWLMATNDVQVTAKCYPLRAKSFRGNKNI